MKAVRILRPSAVRHRNVLDVGIGRGQPPGGRRRHCERGVHPLRLGMDVARKRVGIGGFELGQLPPVDDLARQLMAHGGQVLEHLGRGRPLPGLGLRAARQAHLAEQDVAQLLGRADIEAFAGQFLDFRFQRRGALRQFARQPRQDLPVDADAALFHAHQHRGQRTLQPFIDPRHAVRSEARLQKHARASASPRRPRPHRLWPCRSPLRRMGPRSCPIRPHPCS